MPEPAKKSRPELMSPAGHWPQMKAAVEAGADAVYFGLQHFSARAKVGFSLEELPKAMEFLHQRGVRGFVTFNTLVFDHELDSAMVALKSIADANVDAVIVQDVGVASLIQERAPLLEIHGSTQMSVTSAEGVELARSLGCSRVVLGRELSLSDMRRIAASTDVELEVFVHGALCVSYSGQCFSSEAWGGRSANRGQCAQACRLPYELVVDQQVRDLGEFRYLLSPGDLYALEQIPELIDIGIACVKIEGRYKGAEYVAATTRAYRQAIDRAVGSVEDGHPGADVAVVTKDDLEQVYSRGLDSHFVSGIDHQKVVIGRAPRHRGRKAGEVVRVGHQTVTLQSELELAPGDGVVFDAAQRRDPGDAEEGGYIYEVNELEPGQVELAFGHGEIDFDRIQVGDWLWRTHDPKVIKKLKPLTQAREPIYTRPVHFRVNAHVGKPLLVSATCDDGEHRAEYVAKSNLEPAAKLSLSVKQLKEQLGRLGGTPFHLGEVSLEGEGAFAPLSLLNEVRRELVLKLLSERTRLETPSFDIRPVKGVETNPAPRSAQCHLHVLVRNSEQLESALACSPASITLDYLELYGLRNSVERIRECGIVPRVASPRVLKPAEEKILRFMLSLDAAILVRSGGLLYQLTRPSEDRRPELIGDFSLNVANQISWHKMMELGVAQVTPTHDLNAQQIAELAALTDPAKIEVIAFHHLPVFHTEHCVFCRFLSEGTDSTNCGHPCEKHRVALADSMGRQHPVMADVGCRNTVFGAQAQFDAEFLEVWKQAGIGNYRVEFTHESAEQVSGVVRAFQQYFAGEASSQEFARQVKLHSPAGTTQGSLFVPKDFKKLVQLGPAT